ncbi:hypothetical protein HYV64_00575 [Candidatus Shapirobacteria bacterium]|nr:hypothetical protein [Candidatus Shapirobacteria bacterium]
MSKCLYLGERISIVSQGETSLPAQKCDKVDGATPSKSTKSTRFYPFYHPNPEELQVCDAGNGQRQCSCAIFTRKSSRAN